MKCDGHEKLTNAAIKLLLKRCNTDPLIKNMYCKSNFFKLVEEDYDDAEKSIESDNLSSVLRNGAYSNAKFESTGTIALWLWLLSPQNYRTTTITAPHNGFLSHRVVAVDLDLIYIKAHFPKYFSGQQKIHFMKEINQNNVDAYIACSNHIRKNIDEWVSRASIYFNQRSVNRDWSNLKMAVEPLALALHALQDSFSPGHTQRAPSNSPTPGEILAINVYNEHNKILHSKYDFSSGDLTSNGGNYAIEATADLIQLTLRCISKGTSSFNEWEFFKNKWLRLSNKAK